MKCKYTSDGKKVVVVGKLNAQETIVQEVFVSGEAEIASGENFVVKSLHDTPVESWEHKNLREFKEKYKKEKARVEYDLNKLRNDFSHQKKNLNLLIKNLRASASNLDMDQFDPVFNFMASNFKYVAIANYSTYEVVDFDEYIGARERTNWSCDHDELKLVTLFGRTNGDLQWKINQYSDGSGSYNNITIVPCLTFDDAKASLESIIIEKIENSNGNKISSYMIDAKNKLDLSVPTDEQITDYNAERIESIQDEIKKLEDDIAKKRLEIKQVGE